MRYGITVPIAGVEGDIRKVVDFACLAEKAGWDAVFMEDYIYYAKGRTPVFDPWLTMAAIASRTASLRLGITVTPLARRRPWKVAKEAVTLDHLSGGRLIFGIGLGDSHDLSFAAFGEQLDLKVRVEMLDEALEVLLGLWSGRPFTHSGKHYQVTEAILLPRPVQRPRIPIWVGGGWPRKSVVARAARCDGACFFKVTEKGMAMLTPEDVREVKATFAHLRKATTPFDIVVGGTTPGNKPAQARAMIAPLAAAGATWWSEFGTPTAAVLRKRIEQGPPRV